MLLLLLSCLPTQGLEKSCDPRQLEYGDVRARQIPCPEELLGDGEGRRGDWVLENALVRYIFRDSPTALTRLNVAGGSLIDAAMVNGNDALIEAVPLNEGLGLMDAAISIQNEVATASILVDGTWLSGERAAIRYSLEPDSHQLTIEGVESLSLVPLPGTIRLQDTLEVQENLVLGFSIIHEDLGGWVETSPDLVVGDRTLVYDTLWPTGPEVSGESDGEWVTAFQTNEALARIPTENGSFMGRVPPQTTHLQASATGFADGELLPLQDELILNTGAAGALEIRAISDRGNRIPVTVLWDAQRWPLTADDQRIETGEGSGTVILFGGPAFELATLNDINAEQAPRIQGVLEQVVSDAMLVDVGLHASPDPSERRTQDTVVTEAAAAGIQMTILIARDEVPGDDEGNVPIPFRIGSQASGPGFPIAWSWSPNKKAAHGAAPWQELNASDLLATMSRNYNRFTIVGPEWLDEVGPVTTWDPLPDFLAVSGLDDLTALVDLWDQWLAIPPVGPLTWVEGTNPEAYSAVDIESMMLQGRTVATNGPRVSLRVGDLSIGDQVDTDGPVSVSMRVEAPSWIPLSGAALIGEAGQVLASWSLADTPSPRLDATIDDVDTPWVAGVCWGVRSNPPFQNEAAWAISAPIWLERP